MELELLKKYLQTTKKSKIRLLEEYTESLINESDAEDVPLKLEELMEVALANEKWIGNFDGFHNYAVTYAKLGQEDLACQVLEKGLQLYPYNVDLLSDYIKYSVDCGEIDKSINYYQRLKTIPKERWNWRAFTFSIDYLLAITGIKAVTDLENLKEELFSLAEQFKKALPYEEQSYISLFDIYDHFNEKEEGERVLLEALEQLQIAPKSALRIADIYFSRGDYESALRYLIRCERDSIEPQLSIDRGYLYLLITLCKVAILCKKDQIDISIQETEDEVKQIYRYARIAKELLWGKTSMRKNLETIIKVVEIKTNLEYYDE